MNAPKTFEEWWQSRDYLDRLADDPVSNGREPTGREAFEAGQRSRDEEVEGLERQNRNRGAAVVLAQELIAKKDEELLMPEVGHLVKRAAKARAEISAAEERGRRKALSHAYCNRHIPLSGLRSECPGCCSLDDQESGT